MNLREHYDLIGQILEERPELAEVPVSLITEGAEELKTIVVYASRIFLQGYESLLKEEELLWQHP